MAVSSDRKTLKSQNRIEVINLLRGLAALAVCWHHYSHILEDGFLKSTGRYGGVGIAIFFVISGFIIPWSLYQSGYKLSNFFTFMKKRIIRLYPPFLVSIVLIVLPEILSFLSSAKQGTPFPIDLKQLFLNLTFLNSYFHYKSLSPVFWTLRVEFQYYILIGLIFPLLVNQKLNNRIPFITLLVFTFACFIPKNSATVYSWSPIFIIGILAFLYKIELIKSLKIFTLCIFSVFILSCFKLGFNHTLAGMITAYLITFVNFMPSFGHRISNFLGNISYSLYLLHIPIGNKVISLSQRFVDNELQKLIALGFALTISIAVAYVLYRLVELPCQRLSSSIKYRTASG